MCCADDKGSIFTICDLSEIVTNCFLFVMLQESFRHSWTKIFKPFKKLKLYLFKTICCLLNHTDHKSIQIQELWQVGLYNKLVVLEKKNIYIRRGIKNKFKNIQAKNTF